jgi:TatA/E family protein of Tat protein translocase
MRPEHLFIIVIVAILLFGANRIPETVRGLSKAVREFRVALHEKNPNEQKKDNSQNTK